MRRPLRLTTAEATALLMALRTLADVPGVVDTAAVRRATVKIERAVGDAGTTAPSPERSGEEEATTATVQRALAAGRALRIRYYTASRDAVSQRTVDPMRLLIVSGRGYLEAWCRRAEAVRLFRLDRVEHVIVLDEPAAPPPEAEPTDLSAGLFQPAPEHRRAVLVLAPDAHWVAEYYPVDEIDQVVDAAEGAIRVVMRYADPVWLVRLVLGLGGAARVVDPPELAAAVLRAGAAGSQHVRGRARRMRGSGMDAEVVAWALLVLGVLVMVVLAALLGRHVRRLGRVRAGVGGRHRAAGGAVAAPGGGSSPEGPPRPAVRVSWLATTKRSGHGSLGGWEIVILLVVVVALFGAKRLPDMARSIGQSARVFKGEMKGLRDDEKTPEQPPVVVEKKVEEPRRAAARGAGLHHAVAPHGCGPDPTSSARSEGEPTPTAR